MSSIAKNKTDIDPEKAAAYKEASIEIGKGIALGLVPFLGQAIDIWDTVESSISVYNADTPDAKEEAEFDLVLALIGWVPGPGDGVKKSLRLVNRNPERFAPVLFDLLRYILVECGIKSSPEELLSEIFNAGKLRASIADIRKAVKSSSTYRALPTAVQSALMTVLVNAESSAPRMISIVEKRLVKWKKVQKNSTARAASQGKSKAAPPGAKDSKIATQGDDRAIRAASADTVKGTLVTEALSNAQLGVSGEHIADYYCAEKFGWGTQWKSHDHGGSGQWTGGNPGKRIIGKVSKGGDPKTYHVLYKLRDGANGTGIDSVWRADGNNQGKPYAIVEAKASVDEDRAKFNRMQSKGKKPAIASKLGVSGLKAEALLEPLEGDSLLAGGNDRSNKGNKKGKIKPKPSGSSKKTVNDEQDKVAKASSNILVQMSHGWINKNIDDAVGEKLAVHIRKPLPGNQKNYSRHLFYAPRALISADQHAKALENNLPDTAHTDHHAIHYDEKAVSEGVKNRINGLKKKHKGDARIQKALNEALKEER